MRGSQLQAILWLRWRLFRNQWSRSGAINQVVSIIIAVGAVSLGVCSGVAALVLGVTALGEARPDVLLIVWHVTTCLFLFFWLLALMIEIQRTEPIDLTRFLHLPVSLRGIFTMNYLASHLSVPILIFLPGMLGLAMGLTFARGFSFVLLLLVVISLIFMITAWTYHLRGWLASLMSNPRRRRSIIVAFTLVMMLLFQAPNFYFNVLRNRNKERERETRQANPSRSPSESSEAGAQPPTRSTPRPRRHGPSGEFLAIQPLVPPFWPGHTAFETARGNAWPALPYTVLGTLVGLLGLGLAYRSTVRFYRGYSSSRATPVPKPLPAQPRKGTLLVERVLPLLPAQTAALTLASLRSMSRAPEVRMFLGTNLILLVVFGGLFLTRANKLPEIAQPFLISTAITITFFGLMQILINQFGFDRDGFRSLMLLPVPRRQTLFAKNLAVLPLAFTVALLLTVLVLICTEFSLVLLFAALFQFCTAFLVLIIACNAVSIQFPYRIEPGSMRQNKVSSTTGLMVAFCHLFIPLLATPIFVAPVLGLIVKDWLPPNVTNLIVSVVLAILAAGVYALSLPALGRLLQTREQEILLRVTRETD